MTDMSLRPIPLPGADLALDPHWLSPGAARDLLAALMQQVPWQVHRIRLFGREVDCPRLSCWIGDPQATYRYSGARFAPHPWPAALTPVRDRLQRETGAVFNSVLANLYRDGADRMGWHADDEPELGPAPCIASVSLGGTRRFALKAREVGGPRLAVPLSEGSLLLMRGATQRAFVHALPATRLPVAPRINLTFRWIMPTRERSSGRPPAVPAATG